MTFNPGQDIEELRHTITVAALNYDVWWVYKSKDTRPRYLGTMNRYGLFFQTSLHAHFVALLVALYRLYEKREDTINIPSLLRRLRSEQTLSTAVLDELDAIYARAKPLWVKVSILRNKAFGHRSRAHSVADTFREAAVSPDQLKQLVETTKKLLNTLTRAWDRSTHAFNLGAREDLIELLNDLRESNEASE